MKVLKLMEISKKLYQTGDPSHDFSHVIRVKQTCELLGAVNGANLDILIPAALLHDIVNVPKNSDQRSKASELSSQKSKKILMELGYTEEEIHKITQVILEHSYSLGQAPTSIESAILQDADKLDGLGAIGIMRTVTTGAKMGAHYYDQEDPFANHRELNDQNYTLDHFYKKLFKLPDLMNTKEAREEAQRRVSTMKTFLTQLSSEIGL